MSELKERILVIMEKNSKVSVADIAILLGETEDNVSRAIYEMEHDKIICGYHTLINWNKTNNEKVIAMIEVRVTPQRGQGFDRIAERIRVRLHACLLLPVVLFSECRDNTEESI